MKRNKVYKNFKFNNVYNYVYKKIFFFKLVVEKLIYVYLYVK